MRSISKRGFVGAAALAVGTLTIGLLAGVPAAQADPAPRADDVVGVGSDTLQYMLDFGADGDGTNAGYNFGKSSRLISFDATPDANARAGYLNGSSAGGLKPLNPTIVLRGGSTPVQRPNGSGAGIKALSLDTGNSINFARSSSALTADQVNVAKGNGGVGSLHEVRLATDGIHVATGTTTNAVPLSKAQLFSIYTCAKTTWNQVGGQVTSTIIPVIPQLGSGTRKTFLTDIGFTVASDGTSSPALGSCVKTYEENDPYALYLDSSGNQVTDPYAAGQTANANAIEPISDSRLDLYRSGFFTNPNTAAGTSAATLVPAVKEITSGTPSDSAAVYANNRGLYIVFREADVNSGVKFNGSNTNWAKTLFLGSGSFFASANGQRLLASAGVTPDYADCGVDSTSSATCG